MGMKKDLEEYMQYIQLAGEFEPLVKACIEQLEPYKPIIKEFFRDLGLGVADITADVVKRYESEGFSREEAILLVLSSKAALEQFNKNYQMKGGK